MEKRRRARINHCLNELKSLILEAMKKDVSNSSKTRGEERKKAEQKKQKTTGNLFDLETSRKIVALSL